MNKVKSSKFMKRDEKCERETLSITAYREETFKI